MKVWIVMAHPDSKGEDFGSEVHGVYMTERLANIAQINDKPKPNWAGYKMELGDPECHELDETQFLEMGDTVRAVIDVWDLGRKIGPDERPIACIGDIGDVVHTQEGLWPTVKFRWSGRSSCVTDFEVVKYEPKP